MLTAMAESGKVLAMTAEKCQAPFVCPECQDEVILRKGNINIHHFAHRSGSDCAYGQGESDEHMRCKTEIYNALLSIGCLDCEMEKGLGAVRPDVYFESKRTGRKYAIEVQLSNLTTEKIAHRTKEYYRLGVYVLWLPQADTFINFKKYSPSAWEKWLHATYFGRVYYWMSDLYVVPVHFNDHQTWVERTDWGGGYYKKSKRYRELDVLTPVHIYNDFHGITRTAWDGGTVVIPKCNILVERKQQ